MKKLNYFLLLIAVTFLGLYVSTFHNQSVDEKKEHITSETDKFDWKIKNNFLDGIDKWTINKQQIKADSILSDRYNKILNYVDNMIINETEEEQRLCYKKLKQSIIESHELWNQMRELKYKMNQSIHCGGNASIAIGVQVIDYTYDRIKELRKLLSFIKNA